MELSSDQYQSIKSLNIENVESFDKSEDGHRYGLIDQNNHNSNVSRVSKGLLQEPSRRPSLFIPQTSKGMHHEGRLEVPQDTVASRKLSAISMTLANDCARFYQANSIEALRTQAGVMRVDLERQLVQRTANDGV